MTGGIALSVKSHRREALTKSEVTACRMRCVPFSLYMVVGANIDFGGEEETYSQENERVEEISNRKAKADKVAC